MNMWRTLRPYASRSGFATQAQLATALGITREHLSRVCSGRVFFTEPMEEHIAHLLRLSPQERNAAFGYPGSRPVDMSSRTEQTGAHGASGVLARAASGLRVGGSGAAVRSADR